MNKHLHQDKDKWQEMVKKLETNHDQYVKEKTLEIADLKEQLRDIMFFFEARTKIEESSMKDEITDGQVIVGEAVQPSTSTQKKERKKKR